MYLHHFISDSLNLTNGEAVVSHEFRDSLECSKTEGTKISFPRKAVSNKMMHLGIIQKLLKKLVQLRQKIDIPQLETNKPFLFLPYRAKINLKNKLIFEYLCCQSSNSRVIL